MSRIMPDMYIQETLDQRAAYLGQTGSRPYASGKGGEIYAIQHKLVKA